MLGLVHTYVSILKAQFFCPTVKNKPHQTLSKDQYNIKLILNNSTIINNLVQMQPHMQAFRRCQAYTSPTGDAVTHKGKDMLAN